MKTVAVANMKGGVGKSTLAVHLAWHLAERGLRTLLIDLDPQANSSTTLVDHRIGICASALFRDDPLPPLPALAGNLGAVEVDRVDGCSLCHMRLHACVVGEFDDGREIRRLDH